MRKNAYSKEYVLRYFIAHVVLDRLLSPSLMRLCIAMPRLFLETDETFVEILPFVTKIPGENTIFLAILRRELQYC